MMPEVQSLVTALRLQDPSRLSGQLEKYLRDSLAQAYQGTWSAFTEYLVKQEWAPGDSNVTTKAWEPVHLLQAQVSSLRMILWMGLNLLLVLSGVLLIAVQTTTEGKTVNSPTVAAIMLDSSKAIRADRSGLCNAVDTGDGHGDATIRLRLEVSNRSCATEDYYHPLLLLEDTTVV
ncbi:hypothetical protein LZ30DRAFT_741824, partial [Colletotrichum cereale]